MPDLPPTPGSGTPLVISDYERHLLAVLLEEHPRQRDPILRGWLAGMAERLRDYPVTKEAQRV